MTKEEWRKNWDEFYRKTADMTIEEKHEALKNFADDWLNSEE